MEEDYESEEETEEEEAEASGSGAKEQPQKEEKQNAQSWRKEDKGESPSDIFLDVKSTREGIQLTILFLPAPELWPACILIPSSLTLNRYFHPS